MEDEWESFIAEAKSRGYGSGGSDEEGDEPIPIIPSAKKSTPTTTTDHGDNEPEDAEEAVRQAGVGMSSLQIGDFSSKKSKQNALDSVKRIPPLTPQAYAKLAPPRDDIIHDELAVVTSIGLYPHKKYSLKVSGSDHCTSNKPLPSSMFLTMGNGKLKTIATRTSLSGISLSFAHLFTFATVLPPMPQASTPFVMQFSKKDVLLTFTALNVPYFADRAAAHLALYLPGLFDTLSSPMDDACHGRHTLCVNEHKVHVYGMQPVALHIPDSPFSESLAALTAAFSPCHQITVGRLDSMTGSVHSVQSVQIDCSKSKALCSLAHFLDKISTLCDGDYTILHRSGADNLVVCRERECVEELLYPYDVPSSSSSSSANISLEQLNAD